ncbi:MAG: hypothetical protein K2J48_04595, partial [Muribaculaceae bacterium]|nr:hypothetical protein [Muribaculaceae bacterium]
LPLAYKYFKLSADKGYQPAAESLNFYFTLQDGKIELEEKFTEIYPFIRTLRQDAEKGIPEACYALNVKKLSPDTDDYRFKKALDGIKLAADKGYPPALLVLGKVLLSGRRVPKDKKRGKALIMESAMKGHIPAIIAIFHLGEQETAINLLSKMADDNNPEALGMLAEIENDKKNFQKAANLFERAASLGNVDAMFNIALLYEHGDRIPQNIYKALMWYRAAAEKGDAKSMVNLGSLLEDGPEEIQNHKEAFQWFLKAAESGYTVAWNEVAHCYRYGIGVEQSVDSAYENYLKATEMENPSMTYFNIYLLFADGKACEPNMENAVPWLIKAAELKEPVANFHLGLLYKNGIGVEHDGMEAFKQFKIAAEAGHPHALYELGTVYKYVINDPQSAFECFNRSASENIESMYELGTCYIYGKGCEKDENKAFECYLKAAEAGHCEAQYEVGVCYRQGEGCQQNFLKAFEWYEKAVAQGNTKAMVNCGILYDNGLGVDKEYRKALEYYNKAAEGGDVQGQYCLGNIFFYGREGIPVNYAEAVRWFEEAAKAKEPDSIFHLAICYSNGLGVEANQRKAYQLLYEAADLDFGPAINMIVQNNISRP